MNIKWGALLDVALVSFASAVVVVALVSFALVGLSARVPERAEGGSLPARLGPTGGTVVAGLCLVAAAAIVVYAIVLIAA